METEARAAAGGGLRGGGDWTKSANYRGSLGDETRKKKKENES